MRLMVMAALGAAVCTSAAASPQQFDLVCSGTVMTHPEWPAAPYAVRYRVDLATGRWCKDDCPTGRPFASVTADRLTFTEKKTLPARRGTFYEDAHEYVSRVDGKLSEVSTSSSWWIHREGSCLVAPFSGEPAPRF